MGVEKLEYMPDMFSSTDLNAFDRLRRAIDPKEISNRGKMLPSKEAPALSSHGPHPLEKAGVISRM